MQKTADKKIKVVVTGGAGFIGSHLTDALVAKGYDAHIIDNLFGGRKENINPKATFHKRDIRNFEDIAPIFIGAQFVFHTAALPRVVPSIKDPRGTHDVNVTGTLNVLLAARDAKVKRVVYSASSSAYGDHETLPLKEDFPVRPMHPYGLQKYMGEQLAQLFFSLYGLQTISLRYFNVYGERAPLEGAYAQAIGRFLKQRMEDKPLTIVPDGKQSRDFTHVRDVVRANILAALSHEAKGSEVINIGGGKNYTVLEIAEMIGGPQVFIEPRTEAKHSLADITKAKELLGWEPTITLPEAISELKKGLNL
ncbi:MAG: NAD-dependent epimerase/dehydratase family protein [bacterium]|nr:NAD-dependent epimerase/dehydratase family protein [bacterium]